MSDLTPQEEARYARHLVLPELGRNGQCKLKHARVLLVGVGGLGSASAMYLAAVGIGTLGIVDDDVVSLSNLQRQVLYGTARLDCSKTQSAAARLVDLNPDITVRTHELRFDEQNGKELAAHYDLVVDGTDNFETRYAINDVCLQVGIPYVYGAIFRLQGQASVLCTPNGPCYRCLFPKPPPPEQVLTGEQAGILGAIPGTIGTIQATEAIKWIVGIGTPLVGRLLVYEAGAMQFEMVQVAKQVDCPACGSRE